MNKIKLSALVMLFIGISSITFYSCQKNEEDNTDTIGTKENLKDFINANLDENNIDVSITKIEQYELSNYDLYFEKAELSQKNSTQFTPYSIEITLDNVSYKTHTLPVSETRATVFIEDSNGEIFKEIEINITPESSIKDTYSIQWSSPNNNQFLNKTQGEDDCHEGAATVAAVGRVIAFGSFFGCVPCSFVGGAITALGSIGYIACVIAYD